MTRSNMQETIKKLLSLGLDEKFFKVPVKSVKQLTGAAVKQFKDSCDTAQHCLEYMRSKHITFFKDHNEELENLASNKFKALALEAAYEVYNKKIKDAVDLRDGVVDAFLELSCVDSDKTTDVINEKDSAQYGDLRSFVDVGRGVSEMRFSIDLAIEDLESAIVDAAEPCERSNKDRLFPNLDEREERLKEIVLDALDEILVLQNLLDTRSEADVVMESERILPEEVYALVKKSSGNRAAIEEKKVGELHDLFSEATTEMRDTFLNIKLKNGKSASDINHDRVTLGHIFGDQVGSYKKSEAGKLVKAFKRFDEKTLDQVFQCRKSPEAGKCIEKIYDKHYKEIAIKCHPDHLDDNMEFCSKFASNHFTGLKVEGLFSHLALEQDNLDSAVSEHWVGSELDHAYSNVHHCLGHHANQLSGEEFWIWAKDHGCF